MCTLPGDFTQSAWWTIVIPTRLVQDLAWSQLIYILMNIFFIPQRLHYKIMSVIWSIKNDTYWVSDKVLCLESVFNDMYCRACMSTYLKDILTILLACSSMTIIQILTYLLISDSANTVKIPDVIFIVQYAWHQSMYSPVDTPWILLTSCKYVTVQSQTLSQLLPQ